MGPIASDAGTLAQLRDAVATTGATRILQIGTGSADFSLALASLLPEGGSLIAMEPDHARARTAQGDIARAGFASTVTVIAGDPRRILHKLAGPFDIVVCHADAADEDAIRRRAQALLAHGGRLVTACPGDGPSAPR